MAYLQSKARAAFEESLKDIRERLKLAKKSKVHVSLAEYVMASSIFLGHAQMENYISDVFSGFAQVSVTQARNCSELPENLRAHLFFRRSNMKALVAKSLAGGGEKDFLKSLSGSLAGPARALLDTTQGVGVMVGGDILGDSKYPSQDNLRAVFNRIGIGDVFSSMNSVLRQDSKLLLSAIGSLRTQLAHSATLPGTGYKDIKEVLTKTSRFVRGLDRVMYTAVLQNYDDAAWKDHLC
ncbi:hypothetical protein ABIE56_000573 [Luteibacter sp. 621]|uniref:hypothetical protein n=1 Tax=Luteibacter sp. 621 TaxID=3373916 RepID=UPI003D1D0AB4